MLGIHIAFMPLFILLLPRRVEAIAPQDPAELLSWLLLTGALVAAAAHIVAGHASDRWFARFGTRRGIAVIGVAALAMSFVPLAFVRSAPALFAAIIAFQLALNCAFAPLGALLADHFPDERRGQMAGFVNASVPASSLAVVALGWTFPIDGAGGFLATGAIALLLIAPLLAAWPFEIGPQATPDRIALQDGVGRWARRRDFPLAWIARFLIQLGAAFVFGYLYIYIEHVFDPDPASGSAVEASRIVALLSGPAAICAILATIASGRLSDHLGRRRLPLSLAALVFACGLALLSIGSGLASLILAYALFQIGLAAFLSIDTALVAQLVASDPRRGTLLGVMNLTNTLPAIVAPSLALVSFQLDTMTDILAHLFLACAIAACIASLAVTLIRSIR